MISISKELGKVVIDYSQQIELSHLNYSFPLIGMGFQHDSDNQQYIHDESVDGSIIVSVIKFLKKKRFKIKGDTYTTNLEDSFAQEAKLLQQGQQLGAMIKESKLNHPLVIPNFKRSLKDYQEQGVKFMMAVHHAANFSTPGSGKTTMVLASYSLHKEYKNVKKLLVIGPASCFSAWEEESYECFGQPLKSSRLIGSERFDDYENQNNFELFLTTYQTASNDVDWIIELLKKEDFMVVLDESHYVKSSKDDAVWANAMLKIAPYAKRRVICTGTPMPNGLEDLYSQMTFLWPKGSLLGKKKRFRSRLKNQDEQEIITAQLSPTFYRVTKSTLQLPPVKYITVNVEMSPIQKRLYNAVARTILEEVDNYTDRELNEILKWIKARMIRLLQISSNPALLSDETNLGSSSTSYSGITGDLIDLVDNYSTIEQSSKINKAIELTVDLIKKGEKVLIWTWFVKNIKVLASKFEKLGIPVYQVYGDIPKDSNACEEFNREKEIKGFRFSEKPCILIANPAACSEAISLHRECHHAIYVDRTFNCCQFLQSLDRIHRVGLRKNQETFYYIIENEHSIDKVVAERLTQKTNTMIQVLESDMPVGTSELISDDWSNPDDVTMDFHEVLNYLQNTVLERK